MTGFLHEAAPIERATDLLAEMSGMYLRDIGPLEMTLWLAMIEKHGDEAVTRALVAHCATSPSAFMPAPGVIEARLSPASSNSRVALEGLRDLVNRVGPYQSPAIPDPILREAIAQLGGWARVNEELPDPRVDRFAFDSYAKRFDAAHQIAASRVVQGAATSPPALGLHRIKALSLEATQALVLAHSASADQAEPLSVGMEVSRDR